MADETTEKKGAGARATAAADWVRRTRNARPAREGPKVLAVTVLGPVEHVRSAWEQAGAEGVTVDYRPAPGERGTEVRATLDGDADAAEVRTRLREFKSLVEAGTVTRTWPQPTARGPAKESMTRAVAARLRGWGAA